LKGKSTLLGILASAQILAFAITPGAAFGLTQDNTDPVSWAILSPAYNANGWYKTDVTVKLYGSDNGSGVRRLEYKVDGGAWQTGSQFKVSSEGTHNIYYRAVDRAGNVETANTYELKIDKTAPEVSIPDNLSGAFRTSGSLTIDYQATDVLSGVDGVVAKVDDTTVSKGQVISLANYALGAHTIKVTATDKAGNQTTREVRFGVTETQDTTAPTTTAVYPAANGNGRYNAPVTISFNAVDNSGGAGLRYIEYRVNNGSWVAGNSLTLSAEGTHTVAYRSVDLAGNVEAVKEQVFTIGAHPPARNVVNSTDHLIADIRSYVQSGKIRGK